MELRYEVGDATAPQGSGPRVIVHICNDVGKWGKGFVLAVSRRWREPERRYRAWARGAEPAAFALGAVQFVEVEAGLWVANLVGQHDVRPQGGTPPVRYEAIREGLRVVAAFAREHGATVHMPRIGAGLAGGTWSEIAPIIEGELLAHGVAVTVYDLPAAADRVERARAAIAEGNMHGWIATDPEMGEPTGEVFDGQGNLRG